MILKIFTSVFTLEKPVLLYEKEKLMMETRIVLTEDGKISDKDYDRLFMYNITEVILEGRPPLNLVKQLQTFIKK